MEAGLEPFDTEQMSVGHELMSVAPTLLTFEYIRKLVLPTQEAIYEIHEAINPDRLSVVKALKSIIETLKPIVDALKSSALCGPEGSLQNTEDYKTTTRVVFNFCSLERLTR